MPLAILALAISAFAVGTTEFVIMGLLSDVAADLSVSVPVAGHLVSGYALGVVAGALPLAALTTRLPRRAVLVLLMSVFVGGNLLAGVAPGYGLLLAARVLVSLAHGAFFGVASVTAADLVAPDRRATAISLIFSGMTVSTILGVPLGTLVGQHFGWRATFLSVALVGFLGLLSILVLLPARPRPAAGGLRTELRAFRRRQVWVTLLVTTLVSAAIFASFTYIEPMLVTVTGFAPAAVTVILMLYGVGMSVGNLLGGHFAGKFPVGTLHTTLTALAVLLAVLAYSIHFRTPAVITLTLLGLCGTAAIPTLQHRIMQVAPTARTLASAANVAALNVGNALAAWLGGLAIDAGFGYASPNLVGALLAIAATVIAVVTHLTGPGPDAERTTPRTGTQAPTRAP
ncbi:MFS transporter [Streptomyces angustmyceticus]|uniref:MFS transporter n=1 Tax=Streptomyces angustmyceticus TaxID=285578 RepID=A0A5J4L6M6_9ACTN|nr:MFS transporter [Streptomyces angustmyceticus]QZN83606.1 MFS transporter [Streptomyces angustmyceticus]UAL65153.1 MFS transporter [Streptomyces angustmyceticus]GES28404.1 MFS transporter [Streptomyces angustmyceticus]